MVKNLNTEGWRKIEEQLQQAKKLGKKWRLKEYKDPLLKILD
ncbi:MAG: hypothetical protein ABIH76_07985 [Candidatus Bathyarchaeota archaeon]